MPRLNCTADIAVFHSMNLTASSRSIAWIVLSAMAFTAPVHAEPAGRLALEREERELLARINAYREAQGSEPLSSAPRLNAVAFDHSSDMAARGYFEHRTPEGISPFDRMNRAGYDSDAMGENLAAGHPDAETTFEQWRTSPAHDRAMRNPRYRFAGLGRVFKRNSRYEYYWTLVLGDSAPRPITAELRPNGSGPSVPDRTPAITTARAARSARNTPTATNEPRPGRRIVIIDCPDAHLAF